LFCQEINWAPYHILLTAWHRVPKYRIEKGLAGQCNSVGNRVEVSDKTLEDFTGLR